MNSRQRVSAALNFQTPDRLPVCDALWDGLREDWIQEGMPADVSPADHFGWDLEPMFIAHGSGAMADNERQFAQ